MNKFLSKNKNFLVKKNFFDKKIFKIFYEELDKEVNKILKTLRITQYKKLSLDIKLLLLEEIDHKLISDLYSKIKTFKSINKILNLSKIKKLLSKLFKSEFRSHTSAVRIDLSNNTNWNLKWHQESNYVGHEKKHVFIWFPILHSQSDTSGGLEIYKKFTNNIFPFRKESNKDHQIQKVPLINISEKDKNIQHVKLNIGDILLFDKFLLHRSAINSSLKAKLTCVLSFEDNY